jgi:starch phosphorylase
MIRDG